MVDTPYAEAQVRKLAQKKGYPAWQPEAESELFRVARKYARSTIQLADVIREFIENASACPDPAELKAALQKPAEGQQPAGCGACKGSGWREQRSLDGDVAMARCDCDLGRMYLAKDRERDAEFRKRYAWMYGGQL